MAVDFDAAAEFQRTLTTDPQTWTHTPVGTPRAIVVAVVHGTSATDHVSGVTYGGVAMGRIVRATDTANEPGAAELWFLGAGIPTGPQIVSVDLASATTDDMHFVSMSFTAARHCEVVDFDSINNNVANPSLTLQYGGRVGMAVAALYGGGASPADFTPNGNCQTVHDFDIAAFYSEVIRQTSAGSSDFAIGGTASTDDVAYVALALSEVLTMAVNVSDSPTPSESVTVQGSQLPPEPAVADSVGAVEAVTVQIPMGAAVADEDAAGEVVSAQLTIRVVATDDAPATDDDAVTLNPVLVAAADVLPATEAVSVVQNPLACEVADTLLSTEAVTVAIPMPVSAVDEIPATDVVTVLGTPLLAVVADDDVPTEAVGVQLPIEVVGVEAVSEVDVVTVIVNPLAPTVADAIGVAEAAAVEINPIVVSVSDDDVAADVVAIALPVQVVASEDVVATEFVAILVNPLLVDVADVKALGEAVLVSSRDAVTIAVADDIGAVDEALGMLSLRVTADDAEMIDDVVIVALSLRILVVDVEPIDESVGCAVPLGLLVFDANQAESGGFSLFSFVEEGLTPTEEVLVSLSGMGLQVIAADGVSIAERRSVLAAGLEEAVFGGGAVRTATITGELVLAGTTAGEGIDA